MNTFAVVASSVWSFFLQNAFDWESDCIAIDIIVVVAGDSVLSLSSHSVDVLFLLQLLRFVALVIIFAIIIVIVIIVAVFTIVSSIIAT